MRAASIRPIASGGKDCGFGPFGVFVLFGKVLRKRTLTRVDLGIRKVYPLRQRAFRAEARPSE